MDAEFLRIARRDKKAFLSDQCKEIEETNRMGNTREGMKKREPSYTIANERKLLQPLYRTIRKFLNNLK